MLPRCIPVLLVLVSLVPAGCGDAEKKKRRQKIMKENLERQAPYLDKVKAILGKVPPLGELKVKPCPESFALPSLVVYAGRDVDLGELVDPKIRAKRDKLPRTVLTSSPLRYLMVRDDKYVGWRRNAIDSVLRSPFLGIFVTDRYQEGQVRGKKIVKPTWFTGWFLLADLEKNAILAQVQATGRNTNQIMAMRRKGEGVSWARELRNNLSLQVFASAQRQLTIHCPKAKIQLQFY